MRAPSSGSSGFLSIERLDAKPPRIGDTFNLNLQALGISEAGFSHYYYMVYRGWAAEDAGRREGRRQQGALGLGSGFRAGM